jgi:hypothetical protein
MLTSIKVSLLSIMMLGGLVRTCSRGANVADTANDIRKASRIGMTDELAGMGRNARMLDDVANLDPNIVKARFTMFEINHAEKLSDQSFVTKAFKSTEGLSPNMRLKMLEVELMPLHVRMRLKEAQNGYFYSVMMGKKITKEEASALSTLFEVPVTATDDAMDAYHYISPNISKTLEAQELHALNKQKMATARALNKDSYIPPLEPRKISSSRGETFMDQFSTYWNGTKKTEPQTILTEQPLPKEDARTLVYHGIKTVRHIHHFLKATDLETMNVIFFVHENDATFAQANNLSPEDAKTIRREISQLRSKKNIFIVQTPNELTELKTQGKIDQESMNVLVGKGLSSSINNYYGEEPHVEFHMVHPKGVDIREIMNSNPTQPTWDVTLDVLVKSAGRKFSNSYTLTEKMTEAFNAFITKKYPAISDVVVTYHFFDVEGNFILLNPLFKADETSTAETK